MKVLLSWLNDYVETGLSAEEIAEILSNLGLTDEGIEYIDGDAVIDLEITSNRGDCLGYIGVARELAAATGKELKIPTVELDYSDKDVTNFAGVEIAEPELCSRYTARVIEGVKIGPAPEWMRKRLEAIGMRSVNNVVDAANYAMMETSQPPHAFDYNKITDGKIIVRKAKAGERIISIDGSECNLDTDMLIIADAKGPVAVAGVMGGLDTEVSNDTTTVLLEDAYFDPVSVRTTSRKLTLPSEASFRFERTVDIEMIDWASKRTAQLIIQVAGGKVAKGVVDIYPKKPQTEEVTLRLSRLNSLLGIEVPVDETMEILSGLGFQPKRKDDLITCCVPSWRSDIYRQADLIEEVARVHGYDKVPTENKIEIEVVPVNKHQKLTELIGTYLNSCGFYETINVSFIDTDIAELFPADGSKTHLAVKDISRKSSNLLRQNLLGSLFGVLKNNVNAKNTPCRIFEISNTFIPADKSGSLPVEKTKLAVACDGDIRDLRGTIEGLIGNISRDAEIVFSAADLSWAQVGAQITVNGEVIGTAGIVSRKVRDKFDFDDISPCGAEVDFELLLALQGSDFQVSPIPRFPAIERDLSLVVDESVTWANIIDAVNKKAPQQLKETYFVGTYRGKGIPAGKKSITLTLTFRDEDGTLTHDAVDTFEKTILKNLTRFTSAKLRTA